MKRMTRIHLLPLALLVVWAATARAQAAAPSDALVITAENVTAAAEAARGEPRGDEAVLAGDVIRYTLTFTNPTDGPVRDVVLHNPLPEGLRFVGGTARADRSDARAEYSIDGGRTYAARPMIEVVEAGAPVLRPASPEMFTDVRWTVEGWIQPGTQVVASYDMRMPAAADAATPGARRDG